MATVYIETTIPSYYADARVELKDEIERTREWWDKERPLYDCFISPVVVDELSAGDYRTRAECLALVQGLPLLGLNDEILEIARNYQDRGFMPKAPSADALHVAIASFFAIDYVLTWNCAHLANANKIRRLERINRAMDLSVPILATPYMLLPEEPDEEAG